MANADKMNDAIDYAEENLCGEIDLRKAAGISCCCVNDFLRTFSYLAGMTFSEYIRRRKLSLAAFDLCGGAKVIDTAVKYGYESPEAFSRAFRNLHGISPKEARRSEARLSAFPKLKFSFSSAGGERLDYRIIQKPAHEVCGIAVEVPRRHRETNAVITRFWQDNIDSGAIGKFHRDIGLPYDIPLNAALYDYRQNSFSYMICYEPPSGRSPAGYSELSVPPLSWAVFSLPAHDPSATTDQIRSMRDWIFLEWFPMSEYLHAGGPEFEIFHEDRKKTLSDIWIPVIKQSRRSDKRAGG